MEWELKKYVYGSVVRYTAYCLRSLRHKRVGGEYHFQTPEACAARARTLKILLPKGWEEPLPGTKVLRPLKEELACHSRRR